MTGEVAFSVVSVLQRMTTDLTGKTYLEVLLYDTPIACGACAASYRRVELQVYADAMGAVRPGTYTTTAPAQARVTYKDWLGDCKEGGGFAAQCNGTVQLTANGRRPTDIRRDVRGHGRRDVGAQGDLRCRCPCSAP
jgi:hypothetical protein